MVVCARMGLFVVLYARVWCVRVILCRHVYAHVWCVVVSARVIACAHVWLCAHTCMHYVACGCVWSVHTYMCACVFARVVCARVLPWKGVCALVPACGKDAVGPQSAPWRRGVELSHTRLTHALRPELSGTAPRSPHLLQCHEMALAEGQWGQQGGTQGHGEAGPQGRVPVSGTRLRCH